MKKTALVLMAITIISKLLGLLRDVILSYVYGASNISDAYLISITISTIFVSILGSGISSGYIPMYTKIENLHSTSAADKFTNNLISAILILCTTIILIVLTFTDYIVTVFASGFEGETLDLAITFTKISIFSIYFTFVIYIFNGYLQIKGHYLITGMIGLPLNIIIISSIFMSAHINTIYLSIGTIVAVFSQLLFLFPFIKKNNYKYSFKVNFSDSYLMSMIKSATPIILGMSIVEINTIVDRTIASNISIGGISALSYSYRLNGFVLGLFVSTIAAIMYPNIAKKANRNDVLGVKNSLVEAILYICLFVVPASIIFILFSEPIVKLLLGRGAFDQTAIQLTSSALFFYSIGMVAFGIREVLSRVFYSLHDTRTPMVNASIALVLNIILNIVLSKYFGIGGLALATSISLIFTSSLLIVNLKKKIGLLGLSKIKYSLFKIFVSSFLTGFLSYIIYMSFINQIGENNSLILSLLVAGIIYLSSIHLFKIVEFNEIVSLIKKR